MNQLKALPILFILAGTILFAQEKLKVTYEVIPFYEPAAKETMEVIAIPSLHVLLIEGAESQYDYVPRIDNAQKEPMSGTFATMENRALGTLYKNVETNKLIEETKIETKPYLIKDELPKIDWKISKESKLIGEFTANKATAQLNDYQITAWYSPKLNYKTGPDKYWGLPGLILELDEVLYYDDGGKEGNHYKFISLEIIESKEKIKIPTKGKVISKVEFEKEEQDHFNQMMEMYKGGVDKD